MPSFFSRELGTVKLKYMHFLTSAQGRWYLSSGVCVCEEGSVGEMCEFLEAVCERFSCLPQK